MHYTRSTVHLRACLPPSAWNASLQTTNTYARSGVIMQRILERLGDLERSAGKRQREEAVETQEEPLATRLRKVSGLAWTEGTLKNGTKILSAQRGDFTFFVVIEAEGDKIPRGPEYIVKIGYGEEETFDALAKFVDGTLDQSYKGLDVKLDEGIELYRGMPRTMFDLGSNVGRSVVSEQYSTLHMSDNSEYSLAFAVGHWSDILVTYDVSMLNELGHFIPDWDDNDTIIADADVAVYQGVWWVTTNKKPDTPFTLRFRGREDADMATSGYWIRAGGVSSVQWVMNESTSRFKYAAAVKTVEYSMYDNTNTYTDAPEWYDRDEYGEDDNDMTMEKFLKKFRLPPLPDFSALNEAQKRLGATAEIRRARYHLIVAWYDQFDAVEPIESFKYRGISSRPATRDL